MKILKRIIKIAIITFLLGIIVINCTLIFEAKMNEEKVPSFLGYTPYLIMSGSMTPEIKTNDIIVTKQVEQSDLKVGDIASYASLKDNIIITHRIHDIITDNGKEIYIFKGDNNKSADGEKTTFDNIQGKYVFTIPFVGIFISYIKTPLGLFFCIAAILSIYAIIEMGRRNLDDKNTKKVHKKIKLKST